MYLPSVFSTNIHRLRQSDRSIAMKSDGQSTAVAPVNIALVKYWGKRDKDENTPANSSLSVTLETLDGQSDRQLVTITTVSSSPTGQDSISLNGKASAVSKRLEKCLHYIRRVSMLGAIHIESLNLFPTAAGLASSASGYAALVRAVSALTPLTTEEESIAARLGSGSACRSLFDGFVLWDQGTLPDGSDSIARSIFPVDHWPDLRCLVFVLSSTPKETPSTNGMQQTVETSELYASRLRSIPHKIESLTDAIKRRDFSQFGELVMRESNQLHAVCLDSFPPIFYLSDRSVCLISAVHAINARAATTIAAYTFDAGPNVFVFCLDRDLALVEGSILSKMADADADAGTRDSPALLEHSLIRCRVGKGAALVVSQPESDEFVQCDASGKAFNTRVP